VPNTRLSQPRPRRPKRKRRAVIATSLLVAAAVGTYLAIRSLAPVIVPVLTGSGCQAATTHQSVLLDTQQASIAATIAGVAHQESMPSEAVSIAYATAMQESKLHNLDYGTSDSVGVFQQRPSQGWGPARKLIDPVYASTRFFRALARVPGYQRLPVYQAAQAVQHSADGYAYAQYQTLAAHLTTAFTGAAPRAVWCWPSGQTTGKPQLSTARRAIVAAFGPLGATTSATRGDAPALTVRAPQSRLGWSVAAWLVTHAGQYRLHEVRYAGFRWPAGAGRTGWAKDAGAPAGSVFAS
jgi:hypothetical protein